jgi:hypothetical protein
MGATVTYELPDCNTLDEVMMAASEAYQAAIRAGFDRHHALHLALGDPCCKREDRD